MNLASITFPIRVIGTVVHGFGRGSKELGIPTANLDPEAVATVHHQLDSAYGIYYGWAWFQNDDHASKNILYPMVMSFGLNPQYNNEQPSVEAHLIHQFDEDFYGTRMGLSIEGHIRDEMKFSSLDELIVRIHADIDYAKQQLMSQNIETTTLNE